MGGRKVLEEEEELSRRRATICGRGRGTIEGSFCRKLEEFQVKKLRLKGFEEERRGQRLRRFTSQWMIDRGRVWRAKGAKRLPFMARRSAWVVLTTSHLNTSGFGPKRTDNR